MNQRFSLDADGLTDPGLQRQNNEDTWIGPPDLSPEIAAQKGYLYIVADGVGGHQGGEIASQIAVQTTQQVYYSDGNPNIEGSLKNAIEEANRRIYHQGISKAEEYGMSTTITAAVVRGNELVLANVGDSRAYLIRNGRAQQLTSDHTWVEERRQAGILTDEEAANHPRRNVITRSLGGDLHVQVDVYSSQPLARGDQILLCSDGLSDLVNGHEIANLANKNQSATSAVKQMVTLAKQRGAPDNVTAVLIKTAGQKPVISSNGSNSMLMLVGAAASLIVIGGVALTLSRLNNPTILPPQSTTPSPVITPAKTLTMTTISPTPPPSTPTPDSLQPKDPADGERFYPSQDVTLSWEGPVLQSDQRFHVELQNEETGKRIPRQFTTGDSHYTLPPDLRVDGYRWRVWMEEDVEGKWEIVGQPSAWRSFRIVPPPTPTPKPTATNTPNPTDTPQPTQPSGSGNGEGNGNGGDNGGGSNVPPR